MSRSSTSSSDRAAPVGLARLPLAGVLAAFLILIADAAVFGDRGPWDWLGTRVPREWSLEYGMVRDRIQLRRLDRAAPDRLRAFVIGTSRANAAFHPGLAEGNDDIAVAKLAHARMDAFVTRTLADRSIAYDPDVVVLPLSEFDTHRQFMIHPLTSFGGLPETLELARETGWSFFHDNRTSFFQLALAGTLDAYRYRDVLRRAGLDRLRLFPLDTRLTPATERVPMATLPPQAPVDPQASVIQEIRDALPHPVPHGQLRQIRGIARGPHVRIQTTMYRRAVRILRSAGIAVVIVELPVNPLAEPLYDRSIRQDFLAFARQLQSDEGAAFIPLESSGPFEPADFIDLTHLNAEGARRTTETIYRAIREVAGSRTGR